MDNLILEATIKNELKSFASKSIRDLKNQSIISVESMNKMKDGIVVKIKSKDNLEEVLTSLSELFKTSNLNVRRKRIGRYSDVLEINYPDKVGIINVIIRPKMGNRNAVILEELIAFLLSAKCTNRLKNLLDLPEDSNSIEVMNKAMDEYESIFEIATFSKRLIKDKIPNIKSIATNSDIKSKADLIVTDIDNNKYGISVKISLDKELKSQYNKNLGFGNEIGSMIPSPSGKPWWIIGRKMFVSALNKSGKPTKEYDPESDSYATPRWLLKAKEQNPEIYKRVLSKLYSQIMETYFKKLRKTSISKLIDIVHSSRMGSQKERNSYKSFFKLTYDRRGVTLDKVVRGRESYDGLTPSKIVKKKGNKIVIELPNTDPVIINSIKFNMLDSNKDSLKLRTS